MTQLSILYLVAKQVRIRYTNYYSDSKKAVLSLKSYFK